MATNQHIQLARLQPIGRGSHRVCYPHPGRPGQCIKVLIANLPKPLPVSAEYTLTAMGAKTLDDYHQLLTPSAK